jgi:hypothetical protein
MEITQKKLLEATLQETDPARLRAAFAALRGTEVENMKNVSGYLGTRQACAFLGGIGRTYLWKLTQSGLRVHRLGKRKLFKPEELSEFVAGRNGNV